MAKLLRKKIKKEFFPELQRFGFVQAKELEDSLCYVFYRLDEDNSRDIIDIHFDRDGKDCFTIYLATAPEEGITGYAGEFLKIEEITASHFYPREHLSPRKKSLLHAYIKWFRASYFHKKISYKKAIEAPVKKAISLLPQVEHYFKTGEKGPNIWTA